MTSCIGVGLLLLAGLTEVRHRRAGPGRRPRLLTKVDTATPSRAFSLGLLLAVLNPNIPILLGGLATIVAAHVSLAGRIIGAMVLIAGAELGILGPLVWFLARRVPATRALDQAKGGLSRHEHVIDLTVLIVFGIVFTVKGVTGL